MPALWLDEHPTDQKVITCMATPMFKRMKVLKKFKKKILASSVRNATLDPLRFHSVCGDNIRVENNSRIARRSDGFCKGIVFSSRPVKINERVYIRLIEISRHWSGVIRFGFTSHDPSSLKNSLPKYVCPDLTNRNGYWAKALSERHSSQGLIVSYYVNSTGDVHFALNGEEKGIFFSAVDTSSPLWSVIDVYGNCLAIEMLDPREGLNNRISIMNNLRPGSSVSDSRVIVESQQSVSSFPRQQPLSQSCEDLITEISNIDLGVEETISPIPEYFPSDGLCTLQFHKVKGRNVSLSNDRTIATRVHSEYSHGYVFSSRPILPGEHFVIQVLENQAPYVGAMAFGLTSANPAGLDANDMPEDCDLLLDRPEYWVVSKDVASSPSAPCEIAFGISHSGEVLMSKGGRPAQVVMHVDHTQQLWAFCDLFGNTSKIRMLGILPESTPFCFPAPASRPKESTPPRLPVQNVGTRTPNSRRNCYELIPVRYLVKPSEMVHVPSVLSPAPTQSSHFATPTSSRIFQPTSSQMLPTGSTNGSTSPSTFHECTVCYEADVDSVLYSCGHMCMCYECAMQQWRGRGGGHCPMCRAIIRDVIRTYRS